MYKKDNLFHVRNFVEIEEKESRTWQKNVILEASKERFLNSQSSFKLVGLPKINQKKSGNVRLKSDYGRHTKNSDIRRFKNVRFSETNLQNVKSSLSIQSIHVSAVKFPPT